MPGRPGLWWITIVATATAAILGHRAPGAIFRPILMAMYLLPAVYIELLDYEHFSLEIVWILPLLALTLSDRGALRWSLPRAWRWPLVAWALVVAVSWPIVFMRETDFRLWVLPLSVANTSVGISPWQANLNVTVFRARPQRRLAVDRCAVSLVLGRASRVLHQPDRQAAGRRGRHRLPCWRLPGAGRHQLSQRSPLAVLSPGGRHARRCQRIWRDRRAVGAGVRGAWRALSRSRGRRSWESAA